MTAALSEAPVLRRKPLPTPALIKALADLCKVVSKTPPVPCLGGVMLGTDANGTTLSAFDYETSVVITVDRKPQPTLRGLVPPAQLRALLKHHAPTTSLLSIAGDEWHLTQGSMSASGALLMTEDFPALPATRSPWVLEIDAEALQLVAKRALVSAITADEKLPILECAEIGLRDQELTVSTTDRYRLGVSTVPVRRNNRVRLLSDWTHAQVSAKSLFTVANLLSGPVRISWDDERMVLRTDDVVATLRQKDGQFPKVGSLFPSEVATTAGLDRADLVKAVKYVRETLVRNEPIRLTLSGLTLTLDAGDTVKAKAEVNIGTFVGEPVTIAFNPTYLLDALSLLGDRVTLKVQSPTRPAVLTTEGDDDYRHLIMPTRITG